MLVLASKRRINDTTTDIEEFIQENVTASLAARDKRRQKEAHAEVGFIF